MRGNADNDGWARLFEVLGREENLDVTYGVTASGAGMSLIAPTFEKFGYSGVKFDNFNKEKILEALSNHQPAIVSGVYALLGHAWVIDGGYIVENCDKEAEDNLYYFHCVWGEYGNCNGYYYLDNNLLGETAIELETKYPLGIPFQMRRIVYDYKPIR